MLAACPNCARCCGELRRADGAAVPCIGWATRTTSINIGSRQATVQLHADARCADAFVGAPVEYRVGNDSSEIDGWWSDSAFTAPEGRDQDQARFASSTRHGKQPAVDARPNAHPSLTR